MSRGQEILLKSSLSSSSSAQHSITTRMRMGFNYLLASASSSMDSSDNSSFPPVKSTDKADSSSSSYSHRPTTLSSQQKQRQRAAHINRKAPTSPSRHLYEPTDLSQSVDAELLFHYPPDADPPPAEVSEFCLPVGGRIDYIKPAEEETLIREIFYGQKQGHRSSRCFVFILEDHTAVPSSNPPSPLKTTTSSKFPAETPLASSIEPPFVIDEVREEGGRLYGMCVVHSRLLRVPVDKNSITNNKQQRGWNLGSFGYTLSYIPFFPS